MIPVVLSGGSGTRLWPISRQMLPKQFCEIFEVPLQTMTLDRVSKMGSPWIVTSEGLKTLTEINLKNSNLTNRIEPGSVIYEPLAKNTAPAIALICKAMELKNLKESIVGVFPSDHLIQNEKQFLKVSSFAEKLAEKGHVVTLGIKPTYPETGYGYIQISSESAAEFGELKAHSVVRFHEKPKRELAQSFIQQGNFDWNTGIFIFKVSTMIEHFKKWQPKLWSQLSLLKTDYSNLSSIYSDVEAISIDYAIMENLSGQELYCIPSDFGWSDVGSWDSVSQLANSAKILDVNATGNFVSGLANKTYSFVGANDLIAIDTSDALLVIQKGHSQEVKKVVDQLSTLNPALLKQHSFEERPWGEFETLKESSKFKAKLIQVNYLSQISYQSHALREEHWIVVNGFGEVVLNDEVIAIKKGSHIHIPVGAKHRIRNTSNDTILEFVEVQLGQYFGEDDIKRYQDDYKRT